MDSIITNYVLLGATCAVISLFVLIVLAVLQGISIKKSEERLARANMMVQQCTESLKLHAQSCKENTELMRMITTEYTRWLSKLEKERDKVSEENKELAQAMHRLTDILAMKKDQTINVQAPTTNGK